MEEVNKPARPEEKESRENLAAGKPATEVALEANQPSHQAPLTSEGEKQAPAQPHPLEELLAEWTEENRAWLKERVPQHFHGTALKYGKLCFSLVMQGGTAGAALGRIVSIGGNLGNRWGRDLTTAAQITNSILNDLLSRLLKEVEIPLEKFLECKAEIERIGELAGPAAGPGKLILPN